MKRIVLFIFFLVGFYSVKAQEQPLSQKMAGTAMKLWKDSTAKWAYEQGGVLRGVEEVWLQTGDKKYFTYIQNYIDALVAKDGTIKNYKIDDYSLDNILCGRDLLMLYKITKAEKYYKALVQLRRQLKDQPRIPEGGFWHKKRYPS